MYIYICVCRVRCINSLKICVCYHRKILLRRRKDKKTKRSKVYAIDHYELNMHNIYLRITLAQCNVLIKSSAQVNKTLNGLREASIISLFK